MAEHQDQQKVLTEMQPKDCFTDLAMEGMSCMVTQEGPPQLVSSSRMPAGSCEAELLQLDMTLECVLHAIRLSRDMDCNVAALSGLLEESCGDAIPRTAVEGTTLGEKSDTDVHTYPEKHTDDDGDDHDNGVGDDGEGLLSSGVLVKPHARCLRVLRHTLRRCESCRDDITRSLAHCKVDGAQRHPAAFLLEGNNGPCIQLLSSQPSTLRARRVVKELQGLVADIITATSAVLSTTNGSKAFRSPFSASSGLPAATYTRLLYLCLLQEVHEEFPSQSLMRRLLRALRLLCVGEDWAHRSAETLPLPNLIIRILCTDSATIGTGGTASTGNSDMELVDQPGSQKDKMVRSGKRDSELDNAADVCEVMGNRFGSAKHSALDNGEPNRSRPVVPFVPALNLASFPLSPHCTPSGDTRVAAPFPFASPVVPIPALRTVSQTDISVSQKLEPVTAAELIACLCVLLIDRTNGTVSQSSLSSGYLSRKCNCAESCGGNLCFAPSRSCVLRRLKAITCNAAYADAVAAFEALVAEAVLSAQSAACQVWAGVDLLRRLLVPQPYLLDGVMLTQRIGTGRYGTVFAAKLVSQGLDTAVKMIPIALRGFDNCSGLLSCHREITALLRLQGHPHICEFLFAGCTVSHYVFAMPLYKGRSLRDWRVARSGFPTGSSVRHLTNNNNHRNNGGSGNGVRNSSNDNMNAVDRCILSVCGPIFAQLLEAVEFMHSRNIRHNDLKADNILIETFRTESMYIAETDKTLEIVIPITVRLCDFGVCEFVGEDAGVGVGPATEYWNVTRGTEFVQAPETLARRKAVSSAAVAQASLERSLVPTELAADMWACGCLLHELLTGAALFGGEHFQRLLTLAAQNVSQREGRREAREVLRPEQREALDACGDGVAAFALQLLALEPLERPSASAAREEWQRIMRANM